MSLAGAAVIANFYEQALDWISMGKANEVYLAMREARRHSCSKP